MTESDLCLEIGNRIKRLRKAKGLSTLDLGMMIYVAQATIWRWERAERYPSVYNLVLLAQALGVSIQYLITGEG
ncbi:MAG: helix-turn-helix transcriptional regulator [Akkermansia sp.]|nr:helix-turn-helix transcriptional regulator [Akkermansia sp.]